MVGGDGDEGTLGEIVGVEAVPGDTEHVVSLHHVHTGLVLVHGVEDDLCTAVKVCHTPMSIKIQQKQQQNEK